MGERMLKNSSKKFILEQIKKLEEARGYNIPIHFIDLSRVAKNYNIIKSTFEKYNSTEIYYAVMANNKKEVLKTLLRDGSNLHIQSLTEYELAKEIGFTEDKLVFTGKLESRGTLEKMIENNIQINISSVETLKDAGKIIEKYRKQGKSVKNTFGIRIRLSDEIINMINLSKSKTNKPGSSTIGILETKISEVKNICQHYNIKINGVHGYGASNNYEESLFRKIADYVFYFAEFFDDLKYINLGGGFAVSTKKSDKHLNLDNIAQYYSEKINSLSKKTQ